MILTSDTQRVITITIDCKPRPWARPRANGKRFYTSAAQRQTRQAIVDAWKMRRSPTLCDAWIRLRLEVIEQKPRSSKEKFPSRSDLDNHVKQINDSLNGLAFVDDRQVVEIVANKRWAHPREAPGYRIEFAEIATKC